MRPWRDHRAGRKAALALAALAACVVGARAQVAPPSRGDIDQTQMQLRGVEDSLKTREDARRKAEADIEAMRNDRARLSQALIDTTGRERAAETGVSEAQTRLDTARASEQSIRRSLDARRDTLADVLAALQRIGRKPPPAVLATPDDILRAVRASMLLGAVLPELRGETDALASDLEDLIRARKAIDDERQRLADEKTTLDAERERLAKLVEARQAAITDAGHALASQADEMAALARKSTDLKDLIARSEIEIAAAGRAAQAAKNADAAPEKVAMATPRDPARLTPAIPFADEKGAVARPVVGAIVRNFGEPDNLGATAKGVSFAAARGAVVAAPGDGWVSYSGPWRSFGQILIINAGGGYYMLLAGMDRVNVVVGQFVLAGEPVAAMGDAPATNAVTISVGAAQPVLYVEFWKDGSTIDPGPWWAKPELEKVRG